MSTMRLLLILLACLPLLAQAEDKPKPCTAEAYRQFNFWLGEWTSYSKDGEKQGENRIVSVMNGCGLQENWTGRDGRYQGTSYNFYDRATGQWHQTWMDNQGGHLFLTGRFNGNSMQLSGTQQTPDGPLVNRITWTPLEDGRVRQHWQMSKDAGESWSTAFDGFYQRN